MPTNRRYRSRNPRATLTLADLPPTAIFDFILGWEPGWYGHTHWASWEEYLDTYQLVRDELLTDPLVTANQAMTLFAEERLREWQG